MKNQHKLLALLAVTLLLTNCKKDHSATGDGNLLNSTSEPSLATVAISSLQVETLYGAPYAKGALMNGKGTTARFNSPRGLQLMPDGTIYVADMGNDVIRKISTTAEVSTVSLKAAPYGAVLTAPVYLGVEFNTGNFHIVQDGNADSDGYDQSWVFKANGDFIGTGYRYYVNATALARDPYSDTFYYSSGSGITQQIVQPTGEIYGSSINYDASKLEYPESEGMRGFSWDAIAIGYNKVVYFTTQGRIYKYTPGGVTERIFTGLKFSHITSMIFNKDSRTMYVADEGYIKRGDSQKLTTLAGPVGTNDGHDGSAKSADVYAFGLALAKGENTLYFTDSRANTIRKITLK